MATVEQQRFTPEDLLTMPDGDRYELVDGQLVEHEMSAESAWVAGQVYRRVADFVELHRLGTAFPDGMTYQCFPSAPGKVRRPDGSLICRGRLSPEQFKEGHCQIAPDLALETVLPNDLYYDVEQRVEEYLEAGTRLMWVFNPNNRTVRVFQPDETVTQLGEGGVLTGMDVLPGLEIRVGDVFPPEDLAGIL